MERALESIAQTPIFPILGMAWMSIFLLEENEFERIDKLLGAMKSEEEEAGEDANTSGDLELLDRVCEKDVAPRAVLRGVPATLEDFTEVEEVDGMSMEEEGSVGKLICDLTEEMDV